MCSMLFVLQTSRSPGTPTLYLGVAYKPNCCWLSLRLAVGLAWEMVEVQRLAAWCRLVFIFICVFGLISVLTDMRLGNWCVVFSQVLMKGVVHASLCSMLTDIKNEQSCGGFAPDCTVWASPWAWSGGLDAVWVAGLWRPPEADPLDPALVS